VLVPDAGAVGSNALTDQYLEDGHFVRAHTAHYQNNGRRQHL
jgi:hypothetical protein